MEKENRPKKLSLSGRTTCDIVLPEISVEEFNYEKTIRPDWLVYKIGQDKFYCLKYSDGVPNDQLEQTRFNFKCISEEHTYKIDKFIYILRSASKLFVIIENTGILDKSFTLSYDDWNQEFNGYKSILIDSKIIENVPVYNNIEAQISSIVSRVKKKNPDAEVDRTTLKNLLDGDQCHYCGISRKQVIELEKHAKDTENYQKIDWYHSQGLTKRPRKTLEVDQKNPNAGYEQNNIVLACSWCNNAKTDTFTYEEFKVIAKNINCVWNRRFKQLGSNERVIYPWSDKPEECM